MIRFSLTSLYLRALFFAGKITLLRRLLADQTPIAPYCLPLSSFRLLISPQPSLVLVPPPPHLPQAICLLLQGTRTFIQIESWLAKSIVRKQVRRHQLRTKGSTPPISVQWVPTSTRHPSSSLGQDRLKSTYPSMKQHPNKLFPATRRRITLEFQSKRLARSAALEVVHRLSHHLL